MVKQMATIAGLPASASAADMLDGRKASGEVNASAKKGGVDSAGDAKDARANGDAARARETAVAFEAVFVSQILKDAGFESALGSEIGPYSHFFLAEIAQSIAEKGGFGMAEQIYEQLKEVEAGEDQ